jgi:acyl-coenzyme A thioesterase PaaI-like protein
VGGRAEHGETIVTDMFTEGSVVVARMGVRARVDDGTFTLELDPRPETMRHGMVRVSVLSFLVDAVAGIMADDDPDAWALTSDMSVLVRPRPAPRRVSAVGRVLRRGRRSVTSAVELTDEAGEPMGTGAVGFAKLARRPTDPPKPQLSPDRAQSIFGGGTILTRPLREEVGIDVLDPANGVVQVEVTPPLRNPAGTLQGALVALVAEAAAEDLVSTRFESPAVVTDLELRYLAQAHTGPVRTRSRLLGTGPDAPVEIELVDTSVDRITTLVYARTHVPA